ncbi:hypothetical protein H0H87_004575 [Tephrocybe sp. NHM501043]|nr:hypothetical protein H0H87_004575 [Tephrocybe sp. NHM501043]
MKPLHYPLSAKGTLDPSYVSQFRLHLAEVRAHLAGVDGDDLPPSFVSPTGYWTPSEKNVFFHALSVHSRLRPDLVAASIGTKSVVDVCAYIDILDDVIARDVRVLLPRSDLLGAFEVSDTWVRREENMAEDTGPLETSWLKDRLLFQREEEVTGRKAESQAEAQTLGEGAARESLEMWEDDRRRRWRQEDALSELDCDHLKVMERILRDKEGGDADVGTKSEDQEPEELRVPFLGSEPPDRVPQTSVITDDGMIDPLLLQLSGVVVPDQRSINHSPHVQHPHTLPPFNTAYTPSPPPAPLVAEPLDYTRSLSPNDDANLAIDHPSLSPASRRRVQKRLHMRRKRAAQRGEAVIEAAAKLRPGRKVKQRQGSKSRGKQSAVQPDLLEGDDEEEDALMDVDQKYENAAMSTNLKPSEEVPQEAEDEEGEGGYESDASRGQRRKKGGMTKPYKIKRDFAAKGIDADTLIDGNLGLFHLSSLSRLMTFYKSGYDIKGSNAATSISAGTIRLFSAILVEFVTEVVHRSIISREQENSMKAGIKVYHQTNEDITADNVTHALEIMGMLGLTKEQYFAQLLGEDLSEAHEVEETAEEADDEAETEEPGDANGSYDDDSRMEGPNGSPILLPVHREIHPPLVNLPKSLQPSAPVLSGMSILSEDQLLPTETDDDELFEELDEEMNLDRTEQVLSFEYEADLWKLFGR